MTGLVGWFPLHRTDEDAIDLSGGGNHGFVDGATQGMAGIGGLRAYAFDGVDDSVLGSQSLGELAGGYTIAAWHRAPSQSYTANHAVVTNYHGSYDDGFYMLGSDDGNGMYWYVRNQGSTSARTARYAGWDGSWHHYVGVRDARAGDLRFYVDGTLQETLTAPEGATYDSAGGSQLSLMKHAGRYTHGQLCDVRLYDRVLSAREVQTLYDWGASDSARPPGASAGGVAYYPLDEDSGTTAADAWGANDGTISGATVGAPGVRDTAYSFDGTDDSVNLPPLGFVGDTSITIAAWINVAAGATDANNLFFFGDETTNNACSIRTNGDGAFRFFFWGNDLDVSGPSYFGHWAHVAGVYDAAAGYRAVYLNGERLGSDSPAAPTFVDNDYTIGYRPESASEYFQGAIDDVRIYNRALDPWELQAVYRYGTRGRDLRAATITAR